MKASANEIAIRNHNTLRAFVTKISVAMPKAETSRYIVCDDGQKVFFDLRDFDPEHVAQLVDDHNEYLRVSRRRKQKAQYTALKQFALMHHPV